MQIVIDMPQKVYKAICDKNALGCDISDIKNIIRNGTPLPKGHGRLIDADEVIDNLFNSSLYDDDYYYSIAWHKVKDTPTIIEADKEE